MRAGFCGRSVAWAGIVRSATEKGLNPSTPENFRAIPGEGAEALVGGKKVHVVSPGYLKERGLAVPEDRIGRLAAEGKTVVYVFADDRLVGAIALADLIRPESREALKALKQMGIQSMLLTGDSAAG